MKLPQWIMVAALALILALPFALRPDKPDSGVAEDTLVIITPHNEAIRHEFAVGFGKWYLAQTGRRIFIDWRVIGGTSEIARFLEGEYVASFRNHWTAELNQPWSSAVLGAFAARSLGDSATEEMKAARAAFLASDVSCGIDIFFGGGTYDFVRQAQAGRLVDSGLLQKHPEWFTPEVIPQSWAGEEYWDPEGRWLGTVLSSYGMIFNRDAFTRLGIPKEPDSWTDLEDPRLLGEIALADPTKSGSITKAFENVIQQQMQLRLNALVAAGQTPEAAEPQAVREGWLAGLQLLQLAGANARYFTDSSQKPPIDVAQGNSAVGMCIDFYGRQQQEAVRRRGDSDRVGYASPVGGSVSSVDPIGLMRGAPNREAGEMFIEYVMSMDGQKLWNFKPDTPGGPEHFALRRLPVRRDFYTQEEWKPYLSDPEDSPYETRDPLIYRSQWTGRLFREMAFIIRVMALDCHDDLQAAWREIIAAGQPPEALAVLQDLSAIDYDAAGTRVKDALGSRNRVDEIHLADELGRQFRAQYRRAADIARASRR